MQFTASEIMWSSFLLAGLTMIAPAFFKHCPLSSYAFYEADYKLNFASNAPSPRTTPQTNKNFLLSQNV